MTGRGDRDDQISRCWHDLKVLAEAYLPISGLSLAGGSCSVLWCVALARRSLAASGASCTAEGLRAPAARPSVPWYTCGLQAERTATRSTPVQTRGHTANLSSTLVNLVWVSRCYTLMKNNKWLKEIQQGDVWEHNISLKAGQKAFSVSCVS